MSQPVDDPSSYPAVFEVWTAPVGTACPGNAVDLLNAAYTQVGTVDGQTLYSYGGLGKGVDPFPITWVSAPVDTSAVYGKRLAVVFQGSPPMGGEMRACAADVTFSADGSSGDAAHDANNVAAYWYYHPA